MPAPRREAAALLILLLPALLAGCGILSRPRDASRDLRAALAHDDPAARDAALADLRGAEPMFLPGWLASASTAGSPAEALALVERGLQYMPTSPDLLVARLSLLAQLNRHDDQVAAARAVLAQGGPGFVRAQALWFLLDALLSQDRLEEAEPVVTRLTGQFGVQAEMSASAWARLALARQVAGEAPRADEAMAASLDLGPAGLGILRREGLRSPAHRAAAAALVASAAARAPEHPDLALFLLVDRMAAGDLAGAAADLEALPGPLPERLVPERDALHARLLLLQGRIEEGVAALLARLDDEPGDPFALGVLLEAWHTRGVPEAAVLAERLQAARRLVFDPVLRAELEATLAEVAAPPAAPDPAATPES